VLATFLAYLIPLFVTIDALGLLPVFLSVTEAMTPPRRRRVSYQAVFTAAVICIGFMFVGDALFKFLHIRHEDFQVAGGLILLVLAMLDLLQSGKPAVIEEEMVGIVPLATPLIAGPGTLATVLILAKRPDAHPYMLTMLSLAINFAFLLLLLLWSRVIRRVVGLNALRAMSKLVMVLLAAIAVNYISTGIQMMIRRP
jgi:multiple antibiotic resistance protein